MFSNFSRIIFTLMKKLILFLFCLASGCGAVMAQTDPAPSPTPPAKPVTAYQSTTGSDTVSYGFQNGKWYKWVNRAWLINHYNSKADSLNWINQLLSRNNTWSNTNKFLKAVSGTTLTMRDTSSGTGIAVNSFSSGTGSHVTKLDVETDSQNDFSELNFSTNNGAHGVSLRYFPSDIPNGAQRLEVFGSGITPGQTVNGAQQISYLSDFITAPVSTIQQDSLNRKPDTSITNTLNTFAKGQKVDLREKLISNSSPTKNIYVQPISAGTFKVGFNSYDGFTTQYNMTKNADGLYIVNGVYVGKTVAQSVPQIALVGTFNTTSTNSYTTTVGSSWSFTFTGNGFNFNTFEDNRGGVWQFSIPALGFTKNISTYSSSTVSSITIPVFLGLAENTYKVIATFTGDDPLHVPSGGAGTSRGWFKYSSVTPQTVSYNTATGVIDPVNQIAILPTGTIDDAAIHFTRKGTAQANQWYSDHGVHNGTRNIVTGVKLDDRTAVSPDSLTSYITGLKKVTITQDADIYYPLGGTTRYFSDHMVHSFTDKQLALSHTFSNFNADSLETDSSYISMISANMAVMNKLTIGDTTYSLSIPGSIVFKGVKQPSSSIKYDGTWAGQNWQIAASFNLQSSFDWPRQPYIQGSNFFTTRSSGVAKLYYNISPVTRTYKSTDTWRVTNYWYIARVPSSADTARQSAGIQISQVNAGGTGTNTAPTSGQLLVGQTWGDYAPKTMSGDATISNSGVVTLKNTGTATTYGIGTTTDVQGRVTATGGQLSGIIKGNGASAPTAISGTSSQFIKGDGSLDGAAYVKSLFTNSTTATVTNTTTETSLIPTGVGSLTLPIGVAGKEFRAVMGGVYSTPAITPGTLTVNIYYGSTLLATGSATGLLAGASNLSFNGNLKITTLTVGASGTVTIDGAINYSVGNNLARLTLDLNNTGNSVTVANNATQAFDVKVQWDTASSSKIIKATQFSLESLN